jgi:hypothetical protein
MILGARSVPSIRGHRVSGGRRRITADFQQADATCWCGSRCAADGDPCAGNENVRADDAPRENSALKPCADG